MCRERPVIVGWRLRRLVAVVAIGLAAVVQVACGKGLLFVNDARVRIVTPRNLATVSAPVRLRWVSQLAPAPQFSYAVFVDLLPVHPGQNLRSLAGRQCASVASCVDIAWLNRHNVYLASQPQLDLGTLPILGTAKGSADMHQVTIVLVDESWRRTGESAWSVTFALQHPSRT